jgi:hypothetical protein
VNFPHQLPTDQDGTFSFDTLGDVMDAVASAREVAAHAARAALDELLRAESDDARREALDRMTKATQAVRNANAASAQLLATQGEMLQSVVHLAESRTDLAEKAGDLAAAHMCEAGTKLREFSERGQDQFFVPSYEAYRRRAGGEGASDFRAYMNGLRAVADSCLSFGKRIFQRIREAAAKLRSGSVSQVANARRDIVELADQARAGVRLHASSLQENARVVLARIEDAGMRVEATAQRLQARVVSSPAYRVAAAHAQALGGVVHDAAQGVGRRYSAHLATASARMAVQLASTPEQWTQLMAERSAALRLMGFSWSRGEPDERGKVAARWQMTSIIDGVSSQAGEMTVDAGADCEERAVMAAWDQLLGNACFLANVDQNSLSDPQAEIAQVLLVQQELGLAHAQDDAQTSPLRQRFAA